MASFDQEQYAFIVKALASYLSPPAVVAEFAARWRSTPCTLDDVAALSRDKLDDGWRAYFDQEREAFLSAPTGDKRVRIGELHRMFVIARDRGAVGQAADLLKQIAEEVGKGGGLSDSTAGEAQNGPITWQIVDPAT